MTGFKGPLGIVGGIGPAATAFAFNRVIQICQGERAAIEDTDFPTVHIACVPIEGIDETGLSEEPHPGAVTHSLASSYNLFRQANVVAVYLSCNTLQMHRPPNASHGIIEINPIEEGLDYIAKHHTPAKIAVLSSRYTRTYGLYETTNRPGNGINFVSIDEETQEQVDHLIRAAMGGVDLEENKKALLELCEKLLRDCDLVVLGCTELSLLANQQHNLVSGVVDSQEVALRTLLEIGSR